MLKKKHLIRAHNHHCGLILHVIPYLALVSLIWPLSIKQGKLCELSQLPSSQKASSLSAARLIPPILIHYLCSYLDLSCLLILIDEEFRLKSC